MSKLEDQLKESRRKVRPDLRAPAGGWAAVQAGLAASTVAAGTAAAAGEAAAAKAAGSAAAGQAAAATAATAAAGTTATTIAKASILATIIKAVTGLAVAGAIAAGGYYVGVHQEETTTLPEATHSTASPVGELNDPTSSANSVTNTSTQTNDNSTLSNEQAVNVTTADEAVATRSTHSSVPSVDQGARNNSGKGGDFGPTNAASQSEGQRKAAPNQLQGSAQLPVTQGPDPVTSEVPVPTNPSGADNKVQTPELPVDTTRTVTPGNSYAANEEEPVEASASSTAETLLTNSKNVTVAKLTAEPHTAVDFRFSSSPLALEDEVVGAAENYRFKKAPGPSGWYFHGGVNAILFRQWRSRSSASVLQRADGITNPDDVFTLPNGELVETELTNSFINTERQEKGISYRLGYTRQTHWGGVLRGRLTHYRYDNEWMFDRSLLADDQVVSFAFTKERYTFIDVEFQYTLLRRHRFRPYAGIGTTLFVVGSRKRGTHFFDAQTGQEALASSSSQNLFGTEIDLTVTLGFQYQISPRLSLGLNAWSNSGVNFFVDAPYGIEARYLLY